MMHCKGHKSTPVVHSNRGIFYKITGYYSSNDHGLKDIECKKDKDELLQSEGDSGDMKTECKCDLD